MILTTIQFEVVYKISVSFSSFIMKPHPVQIFFLRSLDVATCLFLKSIVIIIFFYLFEKMRARILVVHASNGYNSQRWARQKRRVSNSIWIS